MGSRHTESRAPTDGGDLVGWRRSGPAWRRCTVAIVPGARLAAIPGIGHWPWLERPGSVMTEMERFLASL